MDLVWFRRGEREREEGSWEGRGRGKRRVRACQESMWAATPWWAGLAVLLWLVPLRRAVLLGAYGASVWVRSK